jgi:exodeoxyribonuclease-5
MFPLDSFNFLIKPKTEKLKLGEEQINALNRLEEFVSGLEDCITLSGGAGTGKTATLKEFIEYLDDEEVPYVLAAPTHRAKLVLEALTDAKKTYTLHQLLSLSPNIEIFELDYRDLLFKVEEAFDSKNSAIPYKGIVIIDEASMINDDLFDLLLKKCREFKCKIVFSGDSQQLRPVKSDHISKVFTLNNKITLTKIYRQKEDNPVSNILEVLRHNSLDSSNFKTEIGTDNSFIVCNTPNQFLDCATPYFKDILSNGNVLECKMLAYTNARVNALNKAIRQRILGDNDKKEFNKGEILVGTDNFEFDGFKFYNSLDYVIKNEPVKTKIIIPHFEEIVNGYNLDLYDSVYKVTNSIFLLSRNNDNKKLIRLANFIETTRLRAISLKKERRKAAVVWRKYFDTINSFATLFDLYYDNRVIKKKTFNYGYAISVHKSQGTTLGNVFVDIGNINTVWDKNELQQLQYVALSRTKGNAYILI